MKKYIFIPLLIFIGFFYSKGFLINTENNKEADKIQIFVSILPQKYFVEKIAGNMAEIEVMVGPGKSPATYEPDPNQVINLSSSDIFFTIGVPFENAFLKKIKANLKDTKIIDTSYGIKKRYLESHSHVKNSSEDKHIKVEDPHIWMSPRLAKIQAENIYNALVKEDADNKEIYQKGYENLLDELNELDFYLKNKLQNYKGNKIFVFHPSFGYFTDEYGLYQEAIETGGKEPVPAVLEKIINEAIEENIKIIFVQPEFSKKSAEAIANGIGGRVLSLNPLNPDYINNMKFIADQIEGALNEREI